MPPNRQETCVYLSSSSTAFVGTLFSTTRNRLARSRRTLLPAAPRLWSSRKPARGPAAAQGGRPTKLSGCSAAGLSPLRGRPWRAWSGRKPAREPAAAQGGRPTKLSGCSAAGLSLLRDRDGRRALCRASLLPPPFCRARGAPGPLQDSSSESSGRSFWLFPASGDWNRVVPLFG